MAVIFLSIGLFNIYALEKFLNFWQKWQIIFYRGGGFW